MAKSFMDELIGYRVKVERDGREIVNVPGILALPGLLMAPKAGMIGMIAAPLLGCSIHLEHEDGKEVDVGKAVKDVADTVADTAAATARTVKEQVEKAWDALYADDPEECAEGKENEEDEENPADQNGTEEDPADQNNTEDDIPTIHVNPDDPDKE